MNHQTIIVIYCFVALIVFGFINNPLKHKIKVDFFISILWPITLPLFIGNYLRTVFIRFNHKLFSRLS